MKSIEEKAENYQETVLKEKDVILRIDVGNAFKEGANYVLDAIQTYVITEHFNLEHIIKQLKK